MRSVQEVGDQLYTEPPSAFTAARDGYVAKARQSGDRAAAAELAAMKRPTQAAWLVNLLALRRPEVAAELVELGGTIRSAQGAVPPGQLRDLSAQRRRALDSALALATTLAAEAGQPPPTRAQLDEVEATLAAAMADDAAAAQVRAGRVLKSLRYSGFGDGFGVATAGGTTRAPASRATAARTPSPAPAAADPAEAQARRAAEAEAARQLRAAAERRLVEAGQALAAARAAEQAANDDVDRITDELAALRERLDRANLTARAARQARLAAERDHDAAHRRSPP